MAFISEIHYQNAYASSSGESESIEIVLTSTELANAADYVVTTYQVDGTVADSISLDQLTPVYQPVLDAYTFQWVTPMTSPDHSPGGNEGAGEPEAIAFVNTATSEVISFYDIGNGSQDITATEGPASGYTSENIDTAASGETIQFDPFGHRIDEPLTADALPYHTYTITGDQIGTFSSSSSTGNGDNLVLTLSDVEALGTTSETYTVIVTQATDDYFNNGQFVTVVDSNGNTIFESVGVQNDAYQGRAAGDPYLALPNGYVIDIRGLPSSPTDVDYTIDDDVIGAPYSEPYGELNFDDLVGSVPCFVGGTMILTKQGEKPVQELVVGDLVLTMDNGFQPIVWVGSKHIHFSSQQDREHLRPICIPKGEACPNGPLTVSPQHRILCRGANVDLVAGFEEALVSAEHLRKCGAAQSIRNEASVTYYHFMTHEHELVLADGNWSESLDPYFLFSRQGTNGLKRELLALFDKNVPLRVSATSCIRPVLRSFEAKVLFGQKTPSEKPTHHPQERSRISAAG